MLFCSATKNGGWKNLGQLTNKAYKQISLFQKVRFWAEKCPDSNLKIQSQRGKKKLHNACLLISIRYVFFIPVNLWWLGTQLIARFHPWDDDNQVLPSKTMATCWNWKSPSKSPTGWWFGTWIIIPTDCHPSFFRGVGIPPTRYN